MAAIINPRMSGFIGFSDSLFALTKKVPKIEVNIAPDLAKSGKTTPGKPKSCPPRIIAATIVKA